MRDQHIIRSQDFSVEYLETLFAIADRLHELSNNKTSRYFFVSKLLENKLIYSFFYEASTRTRFSFETAALRLGAKVVTTENAGLFSSAMKGETLEDTIRVLTGYHPDAIIMRHTECGAADRAMKICGLDTSIINAGDGDGQHPTQALLDVYAIRKKFPPDNYMSIIIGGDLRHSRTVHSLVYLLSKYYKKLHFTFISLPSLSIKSDLLTHLQELDIGWNELTRMDYVRWEMSTVIYWTRTQKERASKKILTKLINFNNDHGYSKEEYKITSDIAEKIPKEAILLHPLPRVEEISPEVDTYPCAHYFQQAEGGLYIRMALLCEIFGIQLSNLT